MAQPLYFLPDLRAAQCDNTALRRSVLKERGLTDVFADVPMEQQPCFDLTGRGPGNKSGVILAYQTAAGHVPTRLGYYPDEQDWTPVGDGSLLWIGINPADPPKPEEMARRRQYGGYSLPLGDGNRWQVPIIRRRDGSSELPRAMGWDAAGRYAEPLKPAFQSYWDETGPVADWYFGGMVEPFGNQRALELALRALSLNYRYGRNEHAVLNVIDTETFLTVLAATIDAFRVDDVLESLKKTSDPQDTQSISLGQPEGSPDTNPAAATCS